MFGVEKHLKALIAQPYYKYFFVIITHFIQEIQKIRSNIKKRIQRKRKFKKGDIIFWKGHVAICLNSKKLIHAYGPEKKVVIMPIIETINRIQKTAKLKVKKISRIKY
jgi:hypothetical protein